MTVGREQKPAHITIIAEAAQGYEGTPLLAAMLAKAAALSGADAVKFQVIYADELCTSTYQHRALFEQLEMADEDWRRVSTEARERGLDLILDIFGERSLQLARELGTAAVKIHSTDFFNDVLVDNAVNSFSRVYFSIGGIGLPEVREFVDRHTGKRAALTLMFGFQAEPTPITENHLSRLTTLHNEFPGLGLGFMDHSEGDSEEARWLGTLAVPYGIRAVEKHLSLDRILELEDYQSALAPAAFLKYVSAIRSAEAAIGRPDLVLTTQEEEYRRRAVKVVVARRDLEEGHRILPDDVALLRTAQPAGTHPFNRSADVVGKVLGRVVKKDEAISVSDLVTLDLSPTKEQR